jgi:hypothetical protein
LPLQSIPTLVSHREAILDVKKEFLQFIFALSHQRGLSGFVPNATPQPFLTFEQHAKRYGDLPMPIALVARVG